MLILTIDNSMDLLNIGLAQGEALIEERNLKEPRPSEIIAHAVSDILSHNAQTIENVDAIFVTLGPGSFTGVRVCLAFSKGMSSALKIPLVGVSTLDVLAMSLVHLEETYLCPLIDAKKGEVFRALYFASKGTLTRLTDYRAVKPEAVTDMVKTPCVFFGTGLRVCEDVLSTIGGVTLEKDHYTTVSARSLLKTGLAAMGARSGGRIIPIYGRRSEAEIKFNVTVD
ncbi:MAG TPA: tRNA (adenosine(37)-N6)-threonylcarbamoyltransferase complex dimerization subunit type 1 TsaB [Syntrophorhabdaceae bacterium]|nr:tRNA (adenosine(37)-N6)-threonylcarbamoyltransferase complex dimerization subunit type 1 TsaB [Syntrophorhabdaceae bacterium]